MWRLGEASHHPPFAKLDFTFLCTSTTCLSKSINKGPRPTSLHAAQHPGHQATLCSKQSWGALPRLQNREGRGARSHERKRRSGPGADILKTLRKFQVTRFNFQTRNNVIRT